VLPGAKRDRVLEAGPSKVGSLKHTIPFIMQVARWLASLRTFLLDLGTHHLVCRSSLMFRLYELVCSLIMRMRWLWRILSAVIHGAVIHGAGLVLLIGAV
jgi:hypothetical protein